MPIYEYRCLDCDRRFSLLQGMVANPPPLECPRCRGANLKRLISRVARVRSEADTLDALDPAQFGDMESPADVKRWAHALGKEMGEDLSDDFEESLDTALDAEASDTSAENGDDDL